MKLTNIAVLCLLITSASAEEITREEVRQWIRADLSTPPREVSLANWQSMVSQLVSRLDELYLELPSKLVELPAGTRAHLANNHLELVDDSADSCVIRMRAYLWAQWVSASSAKDMPQLTDDELITMRSAIDQTLWLGCSMIQRELGDFISSEQIRLWIEDLRRYTERQIKNPITVFYKRIPDQQRLQERMQDFDERLQDAQPRVRAEMDRLQRRALRTGEPVNEARFAEWCRAQTIEPLRGLLNYETSYEVDSFRDRAEQMCPGYWNLQNEANQIYLRRRAEQHQRFLELNTTNASRAVSRPSQRVGEVGKGVILVW